MSNLTKLQFGKIAKYTTRVKKSIIKKDNDKTIEYYNHLKYHIQNGGDSIEQIKEKFENLDKLINNISSDKDYQTYDILFQNLNKCNKDKENLNEEIKELNKKLEEATDKIKKIPEIDVESKDKQIESLNSQITSLNEQIEKLEKSTKDLEDEITNDKELISKQSLNLDETKKALESIFEKNLIIGDDIEKKTKELGEKIDRYTQIINTINEKISTFKDDITSEESSKFEEALKVLNKKLSDSENTSEELEKIKKENKTLEDELTKAKSTIDELTKLKDSIEEKETEINSLKEQINKLENDKNNTDKELDEISNQFDKKIKELLLKIYGNSELVENIITGKEIKTVNPKLKTA